MKNDELLLRQAALITAIADAGEKLQRHIKAGLAGESSADLKTILESVDELRRTVAAEVYIPAMNESVYVEGLVEDVQGGIAKVRFDEGPADYSLINPMKTAVMPV